MACLTLLGKMYPIAMTKSCYIKMLQSWYFKRTNFRSFTCTRLLIFKGYPYGIFTTCRHWQKLVFSFLDKVWHVGGKYILLPSDIRCNWSSIPISARFWRVFKSSFVLPLILRSGLLTLSHTFFSTCITLIQCLTSRLDQYGSSKNINLFFHMQVLLVSFFWVFPTIVLMSSSCSKLAEQLRVSAQFHVPNFH